MNFRLLLTMNALLSIVSGIACVLFPAKLLSNYGLTLMPMGVIIYQFWGSTLIGLGLLIWMARNSKELKTQRLLALSLFITNGLGFYFSIQGQFAGANVLGWSTVLLYFSLMFGYGIFLALKTPTEKKPSLIE